MAHCLPTTTANAPIPAPERLPNPPAEPINQQASSPTKPQLKRKISDDQTTKQIWNDEIAELKKRVLDLESQLVAKDLELEEKEEVIESLRESKRRDQKSVNDVSIVFDCLFMNLLIIIDKIIIANI